MFSADSDFFPWDFIFLSRLERPSVRNKFWNFGVITQFSIIETTVPGKQITWFGKTYELVRGYHTGVPKSNNIRFYADDTTFMHKTENGSELRRDWRSY